MRRRLEIFAVGTEAAQVIWRGRSTGRDEFELGGNTLGVEPTVELGAWTVRGLTPDTAYDVRINGRRAGSLRTLPRPQGALLGRVATVSDLHVGETGVGHWPRLHSVRSTRDWRDAHPLWCAQAALAELADWEPDLLVVKGDLAHNNQQAEYDAIVPIITGAGIPTLAIGGNHDGGNHRTTEFEPAMARAGLPVPSGVQMHRVGAARVLVADTRIDGHHAGTLESVRDELWEKASEATDGPVLVFLHHQFMTTRFPYYIPSGIAKDESETFLNRLATVAPNAFVSSGHTHRNRARRRGGLTITEVGSPKDFPGVWALYELYERGVVQTVWRVAEPRCLAWNELTKATARGVWERWAPGTLDDRCIATSW